MKNSILLPVFLCCLLSASAQQWKKIRKQPFTPPGMMAINDHLYVDVTETINFHWEEYLYWMGRTFGKESEAYKACLPNEACWLEEDSCLRVNTEFYLHHQAYRDYPVVGITQQQAMDFCKWRSDRVFEYYLIRKGLLEWNVDADSSNYFSVERYFAGKMNNTPPDPRIKLYPRYRLPTYEEHIEALAFSDSLELHASRRTRKHWPDTHGLPPLTVPCNDSVRVREPTRAVPYNTSLIWDLRGNVSEWLAVPGTIVARSWKTQETRDTFYPTPFTGAAASVGFRSVCEFVPYDAAH